MYPSLVEICSVT